jgi:BirA family biotin operon repressor/biotin-[acetyl-CoA-carboxylase] ligase
MNLEPLDPATILADLGATTLPRFVSCHTTVGSTMDLARELLSQLSDSQLPALVVADEQTAGRGRMGRPWVAPPGTALLASLAFRPVWLAPSQGVALVWLAAVALCEAVEDVTPLRPGLKWPNDLLVAAGGESRETAALAQLSPDQTSPPSADRHPRPAPPEAVWAKAAGILLEVAVGQSGLETAVIGCGVNVSAAPPAGETRYPATSLAAASGGAVSRLALLRALLRRIDAWHVRLRAGDSEGLYTAWRSRLLTIGQQVRIETPGGPIEGLAEDVDRGGALLVREPTGVVHSVTAGDVGLLP